MQIKAVDDKKDLFQVNGLFTDILLDNLSKEILEAIPFTKMEWQENWERRKLIVAPGSVLEQIQKHIDSQAEAIGQALGKTIENISTIFWLDLPGFTCPAHFDNPGVDTVMQLYLKDCDDAGTIFYNPQQDDIEIKDDAQKIHYIGNFVPSSVRHAFDCVKNTGYIMLNNKKQLHGVPTTLDKNLQRLSCYCYLN